MSMAPCFADTNDLALDPATTAEDTQRILQSIPSHTSSVVCSLSVLPSVLLPQSFYLSLFFYLCQFLISSLSVTKDAISVSFTPNTFYLSIWGLSSVPFLSQLFTLSISIYVSLSFFLPLFHLSFPFPSLSLSLRPANSFIVLGSKWTMSAHMGPQCSPSREGREHQRTPITQCFNWAVG